MQSSFGADLSITTTPQARVACNYWLVMQSSGPKAYGTRRSAHICSGAHVESIGGQHIGGLSMERIDVPMKWWLNCL